VFPLAPRQRGEGGQRPGEGRTLLAMKRAIPRMRDRAKELRRALTVSEQRVWNWLRNRAFSGYKFRRQVPAGPFILDFYCAELRLVIEVDGAQHSRIDVAEADSECTASLRANGMHVIRVENVLIAKDPFLVQEQLKWAIETRVNELTG